MKSTRSSDMAVSFPRVARASDQPRPRTHRSRSLVSDEFAVLDHVSVHRPVSAGQPRPPFGPVSDLQAVRKGAFGVLRILASLHP